MKAQVNLDSLGGGGAYANGTGTTDANGEFSVSDLSFQPKRIGIMMDYSNGSNYRHYLVYDEDGSTTTPKKYLATTGNMSAQWNTIGETSSGWALTITSNGFSIGRQDSSKTLHWFAMG